MINMLTFLLENQMVILRRQFHRPNTDILWYNEIIPPDEKWMLRWLHYKESGKIVDYSHDTTPDNLTMNYMAMWADLNAFHEYDHDPDMDQYWAARDSYNATHGITMGEKILQIYNQLNDVVEKVLPEGDWTIESLNL